MRRDASQNGGPAGFDEVGVAKFATSWLFGTLRRGFVWAALGAPVALAIAHMTGAIQGDWIIEVSSE